MDDDRSGSDRELVQAVLAGTPGAFARLVEKYQRLVWHLVNRMVQHPEDTRELAQEVFLRVHQRLGQFRFDSALGTWIGQIAFSIAARHLQRKRLPLVDDADDDREALINRVGDGFDLETACSDAELAGHLGLALDALPPLQRMLVTLFHIDELSIGEIARIVDLPTGTIKSHLYRARQKLREALEPIVGGAHASRFA